MPLASKHGQLFAAMLHILPAAVRSDAGGITACAAVRCNATCIIEFLLFAAMQVPTVSLTLVSVHSETHAKVHEG